MHIAVTHSLDQVAIPEAAHHMFRALACVMFARRVDVQVYIVTWVHYTMVPIAAVDSTVMTIQA